MVLFLEDTSQKILPKSANCVSIGFSLKLGQFSWLRFPKMEEASSISPWCCVSFRYNAVSALFRDNSPSLSPHSPIVCNWHVGNWKPLESGWGWRRMDVRLWISCSRCPCGAPTTRSRHCRPGLWQTGLVWSHVTFLRRVLCICEPLWLEAKGSPQLSHCPTSQIYSEAKAPVDLPWVANAVYPSDHHIQTLEWEACEQLSVDIQTSASRSSPWLQIAPTCDWEYPQRCCVCWLPS